MLDKNIIARASGKIDIDIQLIIFVFLSTSTKKRKKEEKDESDKKKKQQNSRKTHTHTHTHKHEFHTHRRRHEWRQWRGTYSTNSFPTRLPHLLHHSHAFKYPLPPPQPVPRRWGEGGRRGTSPPLFRTSRNALCHCSQLSGSSSAR